MYAKGLTRPEYLRQWRKNHPEKCGAYTDKYRAKNPDKVKLWIKLRNDKPKHKARQKAWAEANPDKIRAASERYRTKYPERMRASAAKWLKNNPDSRLAWSRARYKADPGFRLKRQLRHRLWSALKNQLAKKFNHTFDLVGCSVEFLIEYLEARFKLGMTWENYGPVWEVDHHIPCAKFDLTKPEQQAVCFHYTNLRPLFKSENRKKRCKLPLPHQAELV